MSGCYIRGFLKGKSAIPGPKHATELRKKSIAQTDLGMGEAMPWIKNLLKHCPALVFNTKCYFFPTLYWHGKVQGWRAGCNEFDVIATNWQELKYYKPDEKFFKMMSVTSILKYP